MCVGGCHALPVAPLTDLLIHVKPPLLHASTCCVRERGHSSCQYLNLCTGKASKLSTKTHLDASLLRSQACVFGWGCHALEVCGALVVVPPTPPKSVTPPPLPLAHSLRGGGLSLSVPSPLLFVRPLSTSASCTSAHTSAYVSIRQHAYVSIREHTLLLLLPPLSRAPVTSSDCVSRARVSICQHMSAYVSIRQHTSAHVSTRLVHHFHTQRLHSKSACNLSRRSSACVCVWGGGGTLRVQGALALGQSAGLQV